MSSADDLAYRRNVKTMSVILAVMAAAIFAALFVPYLIPHRDVFQRAASSDSPAGFTLHLSLNTTSIPSGGSVLIQGWVNGSSASDQPENLTVADQWALQRNLLWGNPCASGWPIGIGVMEGHYTQDNYTLGTLIGIRQPLTGCPVSAPPQFILLYPTPHSSQALASVNGNPLRWLLQSEVAFSGGVLGAGSQLGSPGPDELSPGVYTAVLADEWGDVLTLNFLVS